MTRAVWTLAVLCVALAAACKPENETLPATAVVVALHSELTAPLSHVRASVFDEEGLKAGSYWDFSTRDYTFPYSFTVSPPSRSTKGFRLVLTAYDVDGHELLQNKAIVKFAAQKTLGIQLWLREACRARACAPNESCEVSSSEEGRCAPIPTLEGVVIKPGEELDGTDAIGSMDAGDLQDAGGPMQLSDTGTSDVNANDAGATDASTAADAATCAPACGANAECVVDSSVPRCQCLLGYELKNGACLCTPGSPCDTVDCGVPPAISNAQLFVDGGTSYGQKAHYTCSTGFMATAGGERQCGSDGAWSLPAPTCADVTCPIPSAPAHGSVMAPSLLYGQAATYSCSTDYLLSGLTNKQTCQADGKWTEPVPTCVSAFASVVGAYHIFCALRADSRVACWGQGLAGTPDLQTKDVLAPALIPDTMASAQVAVGGAFACIRRSYGDVFCWGDNEKGQLGNGTMTGSNTIVRVTGLASDAVEIASTNQHSCARMFDGTARCWGDNRLGQLGDGTSTLRNAPVQVAGLSNIAQISLSEFYSCFRLRDSTVACMGWGPGVSSMTPMPVAGLTNVTAIAAGGNYICALKSDATVVCLGNNDNGQLGNATTTSSTTPVVVTGLANVTQLSAGYRYVCARKSDGTVACWGANGDGQVGNGGRVDVGVATLVPGLNNVTSVAAGASATCATKTDGNVVCWGNNSVGQLGAGTRQVGASLVPRAVLVPSN